MITNASCTIFHLNPNGEFSRFVIPAVFFRGTDNLDSSASVLSDGGEAVVFIPSESLAGYGINWFVSKKDYICRGTVLFEVTQKNVPELRKRFGAYTVVSREERFYGSRAFWHIKIKCKA